MHNSHAGNDRVICRFGLNTAFLNRHENGRRLSLEMDKNYLDPNSIKKAKDYDQFNVRLLFDSGCRDQVPECLDPANEFVCAECRTAVAPEIEPWHIIKQILKARRSTGFCT